MCGIAGAIGMRMDQPIANKMLHAMKRRGPDENGVFMQGPCTLLHTRLTIIDPDGGKQPMHLHWNNESYTIVYNGELYNTSELRGLLQTLGHRFNGHSDTEVVIHAYAQWEEGCLDRFNGIFSFAVWKHKHKQLFLARDRMGVKPLFYAVRPEGFLFASEIKTLLTHPDIPAQVDAEGITQITMIGPGRVPGSGVFHGIQELEPGCFGWLCRGKWRWKRYWHLRDREHKETFAETAEHIRYLLCDSIKRQMVSDMPIGTFLSGGLDSSLISSVCAEVLQTAGQKLPTFSVDYKNNEKYFIPGKFQPNADTEYIQIMSNYLDSDQHLSVLTPGMLFHALEDAVKARDLPGMADVDTSLLVFCDQIRKHVKVALSGECADEIFGGYPWYRDPQIRAQKGFPWAQNTKLRSRFLNPDILSSVDPEAYVNDHYNETVSSSDVLPGTTPLEKRMKEMVNLNHRWFMQTLLDRKDRMSMYNSLEVRVPFCDYRIAEYLYGVPWEYKDYQGREKGLLRYAMKGTLPESILERKKSPYPKTHDPHYLSLVRYELKKVLADKNAPIHQIYRTDALKGLLTAENSYPWYGQLMQVPQTIAYMLQINFWLSHYRIEII